MIRFDLNMEHDEVYGKFVFDRLYLFNFVFLQKNCGLQKDKLCFSFTIGIIKNIILGVTTG